MNTPGPWTIETIPDHDTWIRAGEEYICAVDQSGCPTETDIADARLIAAAPDLLAALTELLKIVETQRWSQPWPGRPHAQAEAARAAIAKATGANNG